ncbi:DNA metabolism protein [Arcobacter sp. CECT 8986]|uniref:TIGR03915 family putative DNA repair protein n=1 Tax=Arcobacter sp. CECT 8986 TaxID=2044507 RepID=UPI00100997FD|nr:TIGR03915 family putative DNA repair protein [Arcobacter sp. CECT 8986]RXK00525.1 DNA metabolism protein [Arcobacter sp. CECT 8986]
MILVYDKSFESFLTLVYEVYYKKLKPTKIVSKIPQELILEEVFHIKIDEVKSQKVLKALKQNFPSKHFQTILNIFMCDKEDFELHLLNFIIIGFKDINQLKNINNSSIFYIQNLEKKLFSANHKMTGFLRFEELEDNTLYAKLESNYNLCYFLGKHFYKRLNNQKYIIHDINRKLAFIKNDEFIGVQNVASFEEPTLSKDEEKFKKLWNKFFKSVSIQSRKNEKLQKNLVPLLYRTYMTEFQS